TSLGRNTRGRLDKVSTARLKERQTLPSSAEVLRVPAGASCDRIGLPCRCKSFERCRNCPGFIDHTARDGSIEPWLKIHRHRVHDAAETRGDLPRQLLVSACDGKEIEHLIGNLRS